MTSSTGLPHTPSTSGARGHRQPRTFEDAGGGGARRSTRMPARCPSRRFGALGCQQGTRRLSPAHEGRDLPSGAQARPRVWQSDGIRAVQPARLQPSVRHLNCNEDVLDFVPHSRAHAAMNQRSSGREAFGACGPRCRSTDTDDVLGPRSNHPCVPADAGCHCWVRTAARPSISPSRRPPRSAPMSPPYNAAADAVVPDDPEVSDWFRYFTSRA